MQIFERCVSGGSGGGQRVRGQTIRRLYVLLRVAELAVDAGFRRVASTS
jgi:hypothetical protein